MNEFSDIPSMMPGIYRHYKGNEYRVLDVGCHTETHEYYVVYMPLYEHEGQPNIWVRPYKMFVENVTVGGKSIPRFKKIE